MADKKLDRILADAEKAYQKGDKRKGAKLVDEILRQDFTNPGVWELLYRIFGKDRGFEEFQRSFTIEYYPSELHQLRKSAPGEFPIAVPEPASKKQGFWARLFGRKKKPAANAGQPTPATESRDPLGRIDRAPATPAAPPSPDARSGEPSSGVAPARPAVPARDSALNPPSAPPPVWARLPVEMPPEGVSLTGGLSPRTLAAVRRAEALSGRERIHVVVVDDIPQTRETVIRTLRFQEDIEVVGNASNGLQAIQLVREVLPDVVVMDVNMPDMDGITATEVIKREVPHAQIIILTVQDDVDYIRRAMMAGARDFLAKPPVIEELVAAVERAAVIARQERERATATGTLKPGQSPVAMVGRGKIISVYSPRGGAGCTMIACNLAAALHTPETPVAVVDGNLQFGDIEVFFNVQSRANITDLAPHIALLDGEMLEDVLTAHSSGIKLMTGPRPERSELITGPQFSQILNALAQLYPYVIVDTSHRLTDATLAALDTSDLTLVVTTQDIPSIARTRHFLDLLPAMEMDMRRVMILMNQFDAKSGIEPEKVNQAFRVKISATIPMAREVVIPAVNRGLPFMLNADMVSRPIGRAILSVVEVTRQRLAELEKLTSEQEETS